MRRKFVLCLAMALLLVASAAFAQDVFGWGEQIRAAPGRDAELKGDPLVVPKGSMATVTKVECDGNGFWIQGPLSETFIPASKAVGLVLSPGEYYVYPNLKPKQARAKVSVTAACASTGPGDEDEEKEGRYATWEGWQSVILDRYEPRTDQIVLPPFSAATIVEVECDGDGFWIEGVLWDGTPLHETFKPASNAVGFVLQTGFYELYPIPIYPIPNRPLRVAITGYLTDMDEEDAPPAASEPERKTRGSANGWGEQIRGAPGRNAELKGSPLVVPEGVTATITKVECDGDGFWIQGPLSETFIPASKAVGLVLSPGEYYVYPNLKPKQARASVTVTATW